MTVALIITLSVISYIAGFFTPYIYTRIALAKITAPTRTWEG